MGSCPKPDSELYHYPQKAQEKRLPSNAGTLHGTEPIGLRTAVYETRTYGGVRGAVRHLMADPPTRLANVFIRISLNHKRIKVDDNLYRFSASSLLSNFLHHPFVNYLQIYSTGYIRFYN